MKKIISSSNYLEILNTFSSPTGLSHKRHGWYDGIKKEIIRRIAGYKFWLLAIKLLKPKKIILRDDLDHFQGVLLAAKINNIEVVGIQHGSFSKFHSNLCGPRIFSILHPIFLLINWYNTL